MSEKQIDVLLASHIGSIHRLESLIEAIVHLQSQFHKPHAIYVSYSGLDPNEPLDLHSFSPEIPIYVLQQPTQRTQFQHLEHIVQRYEPHLSEWICFHDDDDLSKPNRLSLFCSEIGEGQCYFGMYETLDGTTYCNGTFPTIICKRDDFLPLLKDIPKAAQCADGAFVNHLTLKVMSGLKYGTLPTYVKRLNETPWEINKTQSHCDSRISRLWNAIFN